MKIIGSGIPRTGNTSLAAFLQRHGFRTFQYARTLSTALSKARRHDAIVDYPMCCICPLLIDPDPRVIVTVRSDIDSLFVSTIRHIGILREESDERRQESDLVHTIIYGSPVPRKEQVLRAQSRAISDATRFLPSDKVLILPLESDDKASRVANFCRFQWDGLPYPRENVSGSNNE